MTDTKKRIARYKVRLRCTLVAGPNSGECPCPFAIRRPTCIPRQITDSHVRNEIFANRPTPRYRAHAKITNWEDNQLSGRRLVLRAEHNYGGLVGSSECPVHDFRRTFHVGVYIRRIYAT